MIYLQYTKTYTRNSVLGHKGQEVKVVQKFSDSNHWYKWAMAINKNDDIDFMVSNFMNVNKHGEPV